jgi:prepilin-type N-terminal cleavage/methylation domain-containing protein
MKRRDEGFSLIEVMVGSAIMSVVMAIATSGFVTMFRATDRAEASALTQTSLTASFARLDRDLRYAFRVNAPGAADGFYFVDYVIPDADNVQQCVRLSLPLDGGTLSRHQWPQASTSADPAATVGTVATGVQPAAAGTNPFTLTPAGSGSSNFDRLGVALSSSVGLTGLGRTRTYDLQFTALNTLPLDTPITCTT